VDHVWKGLIPCDFRLVSMSCPCGVRVDVRVVSVLVPCWFRVGSVFFPWIFSCQYRVINVSFPYREEPKQDFDQAKSWLVSSYFLALFSLQMVGPTKRAFIGPKYNQTTSSYDISPDSHRTKKLKGWKSQRPPVQILGKGKVVALYFP